MDEHVVLSRGETRDLAGDLIDDNQNNIGWWIEKHNAYSTREAIDLLMSKHRSREGLTAATPDWRSTEGRKRILKNRLYARLPRGLRAGAYFFYRYVIRLGCLDGRHGFLFHFLQAFWYRLLVDAKVADIEQRARLTGKSWEETVLREYGHRVVV
jgi:hypothetical protein